MTDWMTQTQAGVDRWLETQRQWWSAVLGGDPDGPPGGPPPGGMDELQRRVVEAWRQSAYRVVDAQAEMLLGAVQERPAADAETLVRQWTDAQREMWQGWLAIAAQGGQAGPGAGAGPGAQAPGDLGAAGKQMVDALREAAERLVQSQAEWSKAWASARSDEGGQAKPGKKPRKPPEPSP